MDGTRVDGPNGTEDGTDATRRAVICVDDQRAQSITSHLERGGYEVVAALSWGIEVITAVADLAPQLVVIDIARVGSLGMRTFRVVETVSPTCRVIALSPLEELELAAIDAGAHAALPEDDLGQLREVLDELSISSGTSPDGSTSWSYWTPPVGAGERTPGPRS